VSPTGEVLDVAGLPWDRTVATLVAKMALPHGAAFHHRSLFERFGPFDESFVIAGDLEWTLRALPQMRGVFLGDLVIVARSYDGISCVPRTAFLRNTEIITARRKNGLNPYPLRSWPVYLENWLLGALFRAFGNRGTVEVQNLYRKISGRPPAPHFEQR